MSTEYKLTCIIVDDFTSYSWSEFSEFDIQYYDYGVEYTSYQYDYYRQNNYGTRFEYGDVDGSGYFKDTLYFDWYNITDLTGLEFNVNDGGVDDYEGSSTGNFYGNYVGGLPVYTDYDYYSHIDAYDSWFAGSPGHGDWVLKQFTDQLVDPSCVEIIAVDIDYSNSGDLDSLFSPLNIDGRDVPVLTHLYEWAIQNDFHDEGEYHLSVGINASFTNAPTFTNLSAIENLLSQDMVVVQAAPNVTSAGIDWGTYLPNVINVGAWNIDKDGYALVGNINSIDTIDILANGYVERDGWGSGWNFGTSFATPWVFADIVNFLDVSVVSALDSGDLNTDSSRNLSEEEEALLAEWIVSSISSDYLISVAGLDQPYGPVSISDSTISSEGVSPTSIPLSIDQFGYVIDGASAYVVNNTPSGSVSISGTLEEAQILSADASSIGDTDGLGSFSYQWSADGSAISGATGTQYTLTQSEVGKQISVTVSYTDQQGTAESVTSASTAVVANVNNAPSGTVTVSGSAAEDFVLTADASSISDVDGLGTLSYQWFADNSAISGATNSQFTLTQSEVGKQVKVVVSYQDAFGADESVTSAATAAVTNVNDTPSGIVVISGTVAEGSELSADTSGLSDEDGLGSFTYQWLADGNSISGATASTFTPSQSEVGAEITVQVSYQDQQGTVESVTSAATTAVANANNAPAGGVSISGALEEGQTLSADASSISDADGLGSFSYQWSADGSAISGATGAQYTLTQSEVGKQISVTVSYTDQQGTAESVTSAATTAVANANNAPAGGVSISGTLEEAQILSADASSIGDTDGLGSFSYQWSADGSAISGATGTQYTLTQSEVGKQISVTVSYTDQQGTAESVTSASTAVVANVNNAPSGTVTVSGSAAEDFVLTADASSISDVDGLGTLSYQWFADNSAISGATNSQFTLTQSEVGKQVKVVVSYQDAFGADESVTSAATAAVTNVNDTPSGTVIISGTVAEGSELSADASGLSDEDGLGSFTYQWLADGNSISGATASTFTPSQSEVGAEIMVQVSYQDQQGTAESVTSAATAAVTNVNDTPSGTVVISGTVAEGSELSADTSGLSDEDGLGSFTYQWLADGNSISGATASTFTPSQSEVGAEITVQVSYQDQQGTAESVTSAATTAVANANNAPAGGVSISGALEEGQTLSADASSISDADGLGSFSYQWSADDSAISGATGAQYTLTQSEVGKQISVTVSYTDQQGTAESVTSAATTAVANVNDSPTGSVSIRSPRSTLTPTGTEFDVSEGEIGNTEPTVAKLVGGDFVVVWRDWNGDPTLGSWDIKGQRFSSDRSAVGDEFLVNSSQAGRQSDPIVSALPDGGWVVAWASNHLLDTSSSLKNVFVQRFDSDGNRSGAETKVSETASSSGTIDLVSTSSGGWLTIFKHNYLSVTQDESDNWVANHAGVDDSGIRVVEFANDGTSADWFDQNKKINTHGVVNDPSGVALANGGFVFVYEGMNADGDGFGILAQVIDSAGSRVGTEISVNTFTTGHQQNPRVAVSSSGNWMVVWSSEDQDGSGEGIYAQIFSENGIRIGQEFRVNTYVEDDQGHWNAGDGHSIVSLENGDFFVTWESTGQDGSEQGIFGQRLSEDGVFLGSETQINTIESGKQTTPVLASLSDEKLVLVWENDGQIVSDIVSGKASTNPVESMTLTVTNSLADEDGLGSFSYQWSADGSAISGATGAQYTLTQSEVGKQISVTVSYTDQQGTAESVTSAATAAVTNVNDTPSGIVVISGSVAEGSELSADTSGLSDEDGLGSFTYQWLADGNSISGATASTFTPSQSEVGAEITVQVSYQDQQGTVESVISTTTAAVANVNNPPAGSIVVVGNVSSGRTLTVDMSGLSDLDGLGSFSYQWYVDSTAVSGATLSTFGLTSEHVGSAVQVEVSYTDQYGTLERTTSAETAPVAERTTADVMLTVENRSGNSMTGVTGLMYSAEGDSPLFIRSKALGSTNTFELVLRSDSAINALDFTISDSNTLGTVTLSSALSGWTTVNNTSVANEFGFSGLGALDGSLALAANSDVVLAEFTSQGSQAKDFEITLENVAIGNSSIADQTFMVSSSDIDSDRAEFTPDSDAMVWLDGMLAYDNLASRAITAQDALEALRLAVGMTTSSGSQSAYDYIAADFNQDGRVTAQDALEILRYAVRIPDAIEAEWIFIDDQADLSSIDRRNTEHERGVALADMSAIESVNLVGILVGDVNDNYTYS